IALHIGFSSEKLTYFIIMAMLFALASVNFLQSALSIGLAIVALISFMPRLDDASLWSYGFLTFGTAMSSLAIAFFLRNAIITIADAKIEADDELAQAHVLSVELREKSMSDSLTGLPNRRAFFDALRKSVRRAQSSRVGDAPTENVWLFLIDLDGFKAVNDIHGHLTGDQLLKQVAGRLEQFADGDTHISRMGGDEFNIIHTSAADEERICELCNTIVEHLAKGYVIDGRQIRISCSLGFTRMQLREPTRSQISHADYALMVAKKEGKNRAILFSEEHAQSADERYRIEEALKTADLETEISLVFQPQYALGSHAMHRAEALARWNSPSVGEIGPERFIKIAEESGLITGITLVVVEKAMRHLQDWPRPIPLSINLSSHDVNSDTTIDQLIELVERSGVESKLIEFEVTETAMMADFEKATANLRRLAGSGFTIALDDFGTGYSNFSYLRALPIQKLKVDKSFIENPADPMTEKVLSSLAGMARILGVHCLLEGVEDEVALLMAKRAGAESVQGNLFGRPMGSDELLELVNGDRGEANAR
ncbi:MAG: EAL domain-containing protein, partial [Erythrobacter sp.]|nr:EAL domain-containing protein [Erythrobacter sp.]